MEKKIFIEKKSKLFDFLEDTINSKITSEADKDNIKDLVDALSAYTFENRMKKKGCLTRMVIDSYHLDDDEISENIILFDRIIK
jgi:ribosomal protein L1